MQLVVIPGTDTMPLKESECCTSLGVKSTMVGIEKNTQITMIATPMTHTSPHLFSLSMLSPGLTSSDMAGNSSQWLPD